MNIQELKKIIKDLPDDMPVFKQKINKKYQCETVKNVTASVVGMTGNIGNALVFKPINRSNTLITTCESVIKMLSKEYDVQEEIDILKDAIQKSKF